VPTAQIIADNAKGIEALRGHFAEVVTGEGMSVYQARRKEVTEAGADGTLAEDLATLRFVDQFLDILRVGKETEADPLVAARAFYRVADALHVQWLRTAILHTAGDDRWEQRAALALSDDLSRAHHNLVAQVMRSRGGEQDVDGATDRLLESRQGEVARFQSLLQEIQAEPAMTLSGLSVAVREITLLADRTNGAR
jgi:glutamate dehydrogenase